MDKIDTERRKTRKARVTRAERNRHAPRSYAALKDSGLLLEPADVFYDLLDVIRFHGVDLRHVAELPMVRLDAVGRSSLEGRVAMVIGLIDFVHKRRTLLGADAPGSVAS